MSSLYPLKFVPVLKEKVWGGNRLSTILNKDTKGLSKVGESWELSGVKGNVSEVKEGYLAENTIEELIEIYMGDLVGDKVYDKFGLDFPLLIKFIDANDWLSIQVHPDDDMALERHESYGKTEMWYVIDAEKDSELITGFNQELDENKYIQHFGGGTLREVLNFEKVDAGDVFFMPAGRVHATGPGILFAEIQQSSDITYRIYDWDRVGEDGSPRELHTEKALGALDFEVADNYKTPYQIIKNKSNNIISSPFFKTNILELDEELECDYSQIDSFIIYMGIKGRTEIHFEEQGEPIVIEKGETVLLPAVLKHIVLKPEGDSKILEVYIE